MSKGIVRIMGSTRLVTAMSDIWTYEFGDEISVPIIEISTSIDIRIADFATDMNAFAGTSNIMIEI